MQTGIGKVETREVRESDFKKLVEMGNVQYGAGYLFDEDFLGAMTDPDRFCLVADVDGVVSGFVICREIGPEKEKDEINLPDCPERDRIRSKKKIGLLDSVCIAKGMEGRGLGTLLCGKCFERFAEDGCDCSVSMAWVRSDGFEPIARLLRKADFERTSLVLPDYWQQWMTPDGECPFCEVGCHCKAALWFKDMPKMK